MKTAEVELKAGDIMSGAESVLAWSPGSGDMPNVRPTVERLKGNDLCMGEGGALGVHTTFGSLIDLFAGEDPQLREQFQVDFEKYLVRSGHPAKLHPQGEMPAEPFVDFPSYRIPCEWAQEEFLAWYQKYRGKKDFIEPAGRKFNPYRGNLGCHLVDESKLRDTETLQQNHGVAGSFSPDSIKLHCDNRYNPYRWVGPINEVQHHEQASLCFTIPCKTGTFEKTEKVLSGGQPGQILLEYELELELTDLRPELNEETIYDFYGVEELTESLGVLSATHWKAQQLINGAEFGGQKIGYGQKRFIDQWLKYRYINPNVQLSLMVNFSERNDCYRLAEFMLASYNQQPIFFYDKDVPVDVDGDRPFNSWRVSGNGVMPTANEAMNEHIVDGGCSGNMSWSRAAVDVFKEPQFTPDEPILLDGGEHWAWDGTGSPKKKLSGVIDITAFYRQSRKLDFFPGQRGYWGDRWTGFEGDDPTYINPDEKHGIEWLGFLFENHGASGVDVNITKMNVVMK